MDKDEAAQLARALQDSIAPEEDPKVDPEEDEEDAENADDDEDAEDAEDADDDEDAEDAEDAATPRATPQPGDSTAHPINISP